MDKERDTVTKVKGVQPPLEGVTKIFVDIDGLVRELGCSSFSCEDSIDKESSCEKHIGGVE